MYINNLNAHTKFHRNILIFANGMPKKTNHISATVRDIKKIFTLVQFQLFSNVCTKFHQYSSMLRPQKWRTSTEDRQTDGQTWLNRLLY